MHVIDGQRCREEYCGGSRISHFGELKLYKRNATRIAHKETDS